MSSEVTMYAEMVITKLVNSRQIAPELFEHAVQELEAAIRARLRQAAYNLADTGATLAVADRILRSSTRRH